MNKGKCSNTELTARIKKGQKQLRETAVELKQHFVGIDDSIDRIISNIEAWFILPELQTRPCIICLWGMTGVGKTDLVRRLVKSLKLNDRFLEVQLTNQGGSSYWEKSVEAKIDCSSLEPDKPGVVLFDEIQRFRCIDEQGCEIHDYQFQDVWDLLSDGKFAAKASQRDKLLNLLFECMWEKEQQDAKIRKQAENDKKRKKSRKRGLDNSAPQDADDYDDEDDQEFDPSLKYKRQYYSAISLKKLLRIDTDEEDIMQWDFDKKYAMVQERIKDDDVYEGDDFSKLLVFISGNLDEAYSMSSDVGEIDLDADVLHKYSKTINFINIKNRLTKRFRYEHIARMGNMHVIYPSLSKKAYQEIINRKIAVVVAGVKEKFGIDVNVEQSVKDGLYRNGVFPAQGTRPLFSTISSMFESNLPIFLLKTIEANETSFSLKYRGKNLVAQIGDGTFSVKYEGDVDKIRKEINPMSKKVTSVHEAGHAVLYALLYNLAPTQIIATSVSEAARGWVGLHPTNLSKVNMLKEICISCGGRVAEELIFGEDKVTAGASGDIVHATKTASRMVREYAMDNDKSFSIIIDKNVAVDHGYFPQNANHNSDESNNIIEDILNSQKEKAKKLLIENIPLFHLVSESLMKNGKISPKKFQKLCQEHDVNIDIEDADFKIINEYDEEFLSAAFKKEVN